MSKKIVKRSLALGALMAFVITGSAMAAEVDAVQFAKDTEVGKVTMTEDMTVNGGGKGYPSGITSVINDGGQNVVTQVDAGGNNLTLMGNKYGITVGDDGVSITNVKDVTIKSDYHAVFGVTGEGSAHGNGNVNIIASGDVNITSDTGFAIMSPGGQGQFHIDADGDVNIISASGVTNSGTGKMIIEGKNISVNSTTYYGLVANGTGGIEVKGENVEIINNGAKGALQNINGDIVVSATGTTVIKGNIIANGAGDIVASFNGEGSSLTGAVQTTGNGATTLTFNDGAAWDVTAASKVTTLAGNEAKILVSENVLTNATDTLLDIGNNQNSALTITPVIANLEEEADPKAKAEETLKKLQGATNLGDNSKEVTYATNEGDVLGSFVLGADGKVTETVNTTNDHIAQAAVGAKLHNRAHMNDMNKRMGELRNANGEHGVWVRMVRGEQEYDGTKAQYNQYQLGYDEKLSTDKRWTVGVAVTFAEGDSNFSKGTTEDDSTAFAIYGSKLNNDGTFVDLIARYARLESDVEMHNSDKGDYSTNGYSISAEFGKRFTKENGMWIEPQVELTYGSVDSAEYVLGGKKVQVGDMDSIIGRVGFAVGKNIKQGNVYARASYLYDFDGETDTTFSNGTVTRTIKEDLGGGWWEVGVGTNINLSKSTYIYADVEKTFGGEVDTNWQWNLGVRYSF